MISKENSKRAAVVVGTFTTAAALGAGFTSAGADGGDWLQFLGGVTGAALAVWGALHVERRRTLDAVQRRAQSIATICEKAIRRFDKAEKLLAEPMITDAERASYAANLRDQVEALHSLLLVFPLDQYDEISLLQLVVYGRSLLPQLRQHLADRADQPIANLGAVAWTKDVLFTFDSSRRYLATLGEELQKLYGVAFCGLTPECIAAAKARLAEDAAA